jgi:hypothetical protein
VKIVINGEDIKIWKEIVSVSLGVLLGISFGELQERKLQDPLM